MEGRVLYAYRFMALWGSRWEKFCRSRLEAVSMLNFRNPECVRPKSSRRDAKP